MSKEMQAWLEERRGLWWWVADPSQLSEEAIVEGVLNHGRWQDFLDLQQHLGLEQMAALFVKMTQHKRRVNLRPEKIALFNNYFNKYVFAH